MTHKGFVSLPFLILFSISMVLCAYLTHKTVTEIKILESLKEVNHQIQKERMIIETVRCLIQCDNTESQSVMLQDEEVWLEFIENTCIVYTSFGTMLIQYDSLNEKILNVSLD